MIEMPTTTPEQQQIQGMKHMIATLVVDDKDSHATAEAYVVKIKSIETSVRNLFAGPKARAHEAHKAICAAETTLLEPLVAAQRHVRGLITTYVQEQQRKEAEERRRLEAEAREREQKRLQDEAEAAELSGDRHAAEEILNEALAPPVVPVEVDSQIAKTAGVSYRQVWSADVISLRALILHVAERPELTDLLEPNMTALNGMARALKGSMSIAGVRPICKQLVAVRGDKS